MSDPEQTVSGASDELEETAEDQRVIDAKAKKREYMRNYMRKYRAKKRAEEAKEGGDEER